LSHGREFEEIREGVASDRRYLATSVDRQVEAAKMIEVLGAIEHVMQA
jgi:hypothetical protein